MAEPSPEKIATPTQTRGMRSAILAQCFGCIGTIALTNGIMLLYFRALGLASATIVMALALPILAEALCMVPCAHMADRFGKKRFGYFGVGLMIFAYGLLVSASMLPWRYPLVIAGVLCYGLGNGCYAAGWFALLSPVVPEWQRGRFFGKLRVSWQMVGIGFTALATLMLRRETPLPVFAGVLLAVILFLGMRGLCYMGLPELEPSRPDTPPLLATVKRILPVNNYASFCCYVFLLMLFTGAAPTIFGLLEKQALDLSDKVVVTLGNMLMIGSVAGYLLGGKAVDRYGTKPVFLVCHLGFSLALLGFLTRGLAPSLLIYLLVLLHLLFGFVSAASSIAISSEMLALIPPENKALSTSLLMALMRGGAALSGVLSSWALQFGLLNDTWYLAGRQMTAYDTVLLVFGGMIAIIVVTLGLVPSIIGRSQWYPRGP